MWLLPLAALLGDTVNCFLGVEMGVELITQEMSLENYRAPKGSKSSLRCSGAFSDTAFILSEASHILRGECMVS